MKTTRLYAKPGTQRDPENRHGTRTHRRYMAHFAVGYYNRHARMAKPRHWAAAYRAVADGTGAPAGRYARACFNDLFADMAADADSQMGPG